ncbi:MAG: disulfide bond formation protein B, partial [Candidatus Aenigmatarchaeota archaeon]
MEPVVFALSILTLIVDLILVASGILFVFNRYTGKLDEYEKYVEVKQKMAGYYKEIILLFALTATSGSLYLSNILGWEPCRLCWFQRIFMYPLVVIMAVAILFEKKEVRDYVIPLSVIGASISVYHYTIQRITQFHSAGCSVLSVSCETQYTFYFGYVTIPMM